MMIDFALSFPDSVEKKNVFFTHSALVDEPDEDGLVDVDGLTQLILEVAREVEEVRFPEVVWRLRLELDAIDTNPRKKDDDKKMSERPRSQPEKKLK